MFRLASYYFTISDYLSDSNEAVSLIDHAMVSVTFISFNRYHLYGHQSSQIFAHKHLKMNNTKRERTFPWPESMFFLMVSPKA